MTLRHALSPIGLGDLLGALVKVIPSRPGRASLHSMGMTAGDMLPVGSGARLGRGGFILHAPAVVEHVACPAAVADGALTSAPPRTSPRVEAVTPRDSGRPAPTRPSRVLWGVMATPCGAPPRNFNPKWAQSCFRGLISALRGHI